MRRSPFVDDERLHDNAGTNGELTKYSFSSNRECQMSMTLIDVSSEDNPAEEGKICTVTVTPVWSGGALDLSSIESGDCSTVGTSVTLDFGDILPSDGVWAQSRLRPAAPSTPVVPREGDVGQSGCDFETVSDHPHESST